jgi:hypothetical protein
MLSLVERSGEGDCSTSRSIVAANVLFRRSALVEAGDFRRRSVGADQCSLGAKRSFSRDVCSEVVGASGTRTVSRSNTRSAQSG